MSNLVTFNDMQSMAESIARSKLFGMQDSNQVLALMAVAQAEGLHPATAARDYHIIQGRPALKADAMLARFQQAGGRVEWKEYTDTRTTAVFTHPNGGSLELTWTIDQAHAAGLVKPGSGWVKYPRAMLRARVVSEGIRTVYPGCVIGTYTPEEIADFDDAPAMKVVVPEVPKIELVADDGQYPLNLPDGSVYSRHHTLEEWTEAFVVMKAKIKHSPKFTDEVKVEKVEAFTEANKAVKDLLPMDLSLKVAQTSRKTVDEALEVLHQDESAELI